MKVWDHNTCNDENESLRQQLAHREAQIVILRDALLHMCHTTVATDKYNGDMVQEALAATADLDGLILCDAEPVAWMFEGLTGTYFGKEDKLPRPEAIQLFRRKQP